MSKATKSTKPAKTTKTPTEYVYAYVFNGGVLKHNHCVVSVSKDHPETTVFNELKRYYGNDVKGAYYKCSKSLEEIQAGINYKLKEKALGEFLYNITFTDTKKILLDITGLKQSSGSINVYNKVETKDENANETEQKAETEEKKAKKASKSKKVESEDDAEDSEPESKKKSAKKTSSKSKKVEAEVEDEDSEPEDKKPVKKTSSKQKTNNTSIELSDDSDEEDTN